MAANTRIQVRRGYSANYTGGQLGTTPTGIRWLNTGLEPSVLAEGEIGYEIDTGKFKIGKYISGGLATWSGLPYAGGSALISETGIGFKFDDSKNAYTLYSYITGIAGGQDGITFQTLPLSGLLNDAYVSGTYYTIGLSAKLETFHDSHISISSNALSSTINGITISGYNNSTITLNPDGGTVTQSGVDIRNLTETVTVTSAMGGLSVGTQLNTSSGITAVLKQMLQQIFEPSLAIGPSVIFSSFGGVANNSEIGTTGNLTVNISYIAGRINGTGTGAGWNSSAQQGTRAGAATSYTISGVNTELVASRTFNNFQLNASSISIPFSANHAPGITALNSIGQVSTASDLSPNPLPIGTVSNSTTISSYRGLFYGFSKLDTNVPTTSAEIRNLFESPTVNASGSIVRPTRPYIFTINIPAGTQKIMVAVPSGYVNLSNGISVINAVNQPETYSTTTIDVSGANGFTASKYFLHYYTVPSPIALNTTHTITVT